VLNDDHLAQSFLMIGQHHQREPTFLVPQSPRTYVCQNIRRMVQSQLIAAEEYKSPDVDDGLDGSKKQACAK
jgi:hypothetical protein